MHLPCSHINSVYTHCCFGVSSHPALRAPRLLACPPVSCHNLLACILHCCTAPQAQVPRLLLRRYDVYFRARSKMENTRLRGVTSQHIGCLVRMRVSMRVWGGQEGMQGDRKASVTLQDIVCLVQVRVREGVGERGSGGTGG